MPIASDTLKGSPHYRGEVFREGLRRCGYSVGEPPKSRPDPRDVLLVWNRHGLNEVHAQRYEAAGARVLVTENGYIGRDPGGHQLYALALGHHLGAGEWTEGKEDRWSPLNVPLRPWRREGKEVIVLPQRGIGPKGVAMPKGWVDDVVSRLKRVTDRPVRVRFHPGASRTDPWEDLHDAWCALTWASGAGIKALAHGVPVFHELPSWIGKLAARFGIQDLESPFLGDRLPMFRRLSYSQWTLAELSSGEPFRRLLG